MRALEYNTTIDTVAFYADTPNYPISTGNDVQIKINNHGDAFDWTEKQTTVRIGEYLFSVNQIKDILVCVKKYHKALNAMSA